MENADTRFRTGIQSVTVAEEIMQDQQIVADDHIPIVSSAYVYQTGIILTDEEIALHSSTFFSLTQPWNTSSLRTLIFFSSLMRICQRIYAGRLHTDAVK